MPGRKQGREGGRKGKRKDGRDKGRDGSGRKETSEHQQPLFNKEMMRFFRLEMHYFL